MRTRIAITIASVCLVAVGHAEETLTDEQMIAAGMIPGTGTQWPGWRGPYGNHQAVDCKDELIEDISKARLVWGSEKHFPGPVDCHTDPNFMGSPVVAENRVYVWHYEPTAELFDTKSHFWKKKRNNPDPENPPNNLRVLADDHMVAMDFATGRELWSVDIDGGYSAKLTRSGDHILTNHKYIGVAGFKVTDGVCKQLWSNPDVGVARHMVPTVYKDHVFVRGHSGSYEKNRTQLNQTFTRCLELETGKLVKAFNGGYRCGDWHAMLSNGKQYFYGGVMAADPSDYRQLDAKGEKEYGKLPRYELDSYQPIAYMSPLIVDGYLIGHSGYRVVCWDLRVEEEERENL